MDVIFQQLKFPFQAMRQLKVHAGYSIVHIPLQVTQHRADLPVQDVFYFLDVIGVIILRLVILAGALAIAQLVFQANFKFTGIDILPCKRQVAGTQGIGLLD